MKGNNLYILAISILIASCNSTPKESSQENFQEIASESNAKNSLDWSGTYEGTLPCADCEGIKTIVNLNSDTTYNLSMEYIDRDFTYMDSGTFSWAPNGNQITLNGSQGDETKYFVSENKIIQLDYEGNQITGELSDMFILKKVK